MDPQYRPKYAHGQVIMMIVPRPGHQILARRLEMLARSERAVEARGYSSVDILQGPPARVSPPDTEYSTKQSRWANRQKTLVFNLCQALTVATEDDDAP